MRPSCCGRAAVRSLRSAGSPRSDKIVRCTMDVTQLVQTVAIYALPVLFAITLHEAAHGYVARHFGDMTAYAQGRISLNPVRHIDIIGTLVVPLAILLLSGGRFLFGWAKPVPVNYSALRSPKRD